MKTCWRWGEYYWRKDIIKEWYTDFNTRKNLLKDIGAILIIFKIHGKIGTNGIILRIECKLLLESMNSF